MSPYRFSTSLAPTLNPTLERRLDVYLKFTYPCLMLTIHFSFSYFGTLYATLI